MSVSPVVEDVRRPLGATSLVFFVVGAAAPLTVLAAFAPLGILVGGDSVVAGFVIPGLIYLLFAVGFTTLSRHIAGGGAFFAYISRGLSPTLGAGAGAVAYIGYLGGQIGFTATGAVFATMLIETMLGVHVHWIVTALAFVALAVVLGYRKVELGARVLGVILGIEVLLLAVFCVAVLARGGHEGIGFAAFAPETVFAASTAAVFVLTFTVYLGFEQTAIYAEEVREPRRAIPRATYVSIALLASTYGFCAWVILQAIGPSRMGALLQGDPSSLVFILNDEFVGTTMTRLLQILMVTSFFAGVLALQNVSSRYLLALGRAGIIPSAFGRVSASTQAPAAGNVLHAVAIALVLVVFALAGADPYTQIIPWTNTPTIVGVLVMQILTSVAVIAFFRRDHRGESVWHRLLAPALSCIAVALGLVLLLSGMNSLTRLGPIGNCLIFVPMIVGAVLAVLRYRRLSRGSIATEMLTTMQP